MNEMWRCRPREFWKLFNKKSSLCKGESVSTETFFTHFKDLLSEHGEQNMNDEVNDFVSYFNNQQINSTFEELDKHITQSEIRRACKQLNSNKACSHDNILYEYLKESVDLTLS